MGQKRNTTGVAFEHLLPEGFTRITKSPKMVWLGSGRNNFQKIISCNYNVEEFKLDWKKSKFEKYDWLGPDNKKYEVKKYNRGSLKKWTLYSEPFFKVATKGDVGKIEQSVYNSFLEKFYIYNLNTGLFDMIIKSMISSSDGVYIKNHELIRYSELEFKCEIVKNCFAGYDRLMIKFRLKES
jgi:hypothetical protein